MELFIYSLLMDYFMDLLMDLHWYTCKYLYFFYCLYTKYVPSVHELDTFRLSLNTSMYHIYTYIYIIFYFATLQKLEKPMFHNCNHPNSIRMNSQPIRQYLYVWTLSHGDRILEQSHGPAIHSCCRQRRWRIARSLGWVAALRASSRGVCPSGGETSLGTRSPWDQATVRPG